MNSGLQHLLAKQANAAKVAKDPQRMAKASDAIELLTQLGFQVGLCEDHGAHIEIINNHRLLVWTAHREKWPPNIEELLKLRDRK
jgi:hypothetical protein